MRDWAIKQPKMPWKNTIMKTTFTISRPLANYHPKGLASCKCPGGLASCKWLSGGTGLLQMIIRRDRPLPNDYPEGPASCKRPFGSTRLFSIFLFNIQLKGNTCMLIVIASTFLCRFCIGICICFPLQDNLVGRHKHTTVVTYSWALFLHYISIKR